MFTCFIKNRKLTFAFISKKLSIPSKPSNYQESNTFLNVGIMSDIGAKYGLHFCFRG
jgi:hypothetical protein